jgi:hypothetical protein
LCNTSSLFSFPFFVCTFFLNLNSFTFPSTLSS